MIACCSSCDFQRQVNRRGHEERAQRAVFEYHDAVAHLFDGHELLRRLCFYFGVSVAIVKLYRTNSCGRDVDDAHLGAVFNIERPRKVFELALRKFGHAERRARARATRQRRGLFVHLAFALLPQIEFGAEKVTEGVLERHDKRPAVDLIKRERQAASATNGACKMTASKNGSSV